MLFDFLNRFEMPFKMRTTGETPVPHPCRMQLNRLNTWDRYSLVFQLVDQQRMTTKCVIERTGSYKVACLEGICSSKDTTLMQKSSENFS